MDRVLQRSPHRTVKLEDGGAVVRKEFTGPLASAEAAREHDRLQRFHRALGSDGRARCPRPIDVGTDDPVFVRMERAPGEPLLAQLASRLWTDEEIKQLASVFAAAVRTYVETFDEPYFDFHLRNVTYEPAEGRVWFFDFGVPSTFAPDLVARLRQRAPLDVSVANLLGSTLFEATRPRTVLQRRRHRQSLLLADAIMSELPVIAAEVDGVARDVWNSAAAQGDWMAMAWYRSFGKLVGPPMRRAAFGIGSQRITGS
ncbi:hypothetical protein [Mycobacterium sp.]|uniref:hypothetical protein n=1 Tax=Mycobacterium sp. TaxID=1785 RepID=UPI002D9BC7A4|nr:hypothetical protein [Mycobacterium sp.]